MTAFARRLCGGGQVVTAPFPAWPCPNLLCTSDLRICLSGRTQMSPERPPEKLTQPLALVSPAGAVGGKSCDTDKNDGRSDGWQAARP